MNVTNFVNESRNVIWLSGYVRGGTDDVMLLCQSSNMDRAIPISIGSRIRRPRANAPCEIKCHALGYRDGSGKNWIRLEAIQIKRASVTATPRRLVALNALRPKESLASVDFSPFISLEQLKSEVKDSLKLNEEIVNSLLDDASKRTSIRDGFQNKAILSGFIGHKAYIAPRDDGSGDLGHILFHLHQHGPVEQALPVRVEGADARFGKELRALHPMSVIAQLRVDVDKDEQGEVVARKVYLSTDRNNVGFATVNEFAKRQFPSWWLDAVNEHYLKRQQLAEKSREQAIAASQAAPSKSKPTAKPAKTAIKPDAMPEGVSTTDEVF